MKLWKLSPVMLAVILAGCPPKDTDDTDDTDTEDPGTEGTEDPGTEGTDDPDTGTDAPMAMCDGAELVELPFAISGADFRADYPTNLNYEVDGDGNPVESCQSGYNPTGTEARFEVELTAGQTIRIAESGMMDAVSYVMTSCDAGDACLAAADDIALDHIQEFTADSDGRYVIVLGMFSADSAIADYAITIDEVILEDCTNGIDDDGNGDADCDDSACSDLEACFDCPADAVVAAPVVGTDDESNTYSTLDFSNGEGCGDAYGPEFIFPIDLVAGERLNVEQTGDVDGVVRITSSCRPDAACLASNDFDEFAAFVAPEDGTYYAIVEAWDEEADYLADGEPLAWDIWVDVPVCEATVVDASPFAVDITDDAFDALPNSDYEGGLGCTSPWGADGPEAVFEVTAEAGQIITVQQGSTVDVIYRVMQSCNAGDECLLVVDDAVGSGEELIFEVETSGVYYVVMEAYSGFASSSAGIGGTITVTDAEVCSDTLDNDGDGDIDCADTDCADVEGCFEICDDTVDNNGDGDADCDDAACADAPHCYAECAPLVVTGSGVHTGTGADTGVTVTEAQYDDDPDFSCSPASGDSIVLQFDGLAGQRVTLTETSGVDGVVHIQASCAPNDACLASADDGLTDSVSTTLQEDGTYYAIVQAYGSSADGAAMAWELSIVDSELCDDTIDNDGDGDIDCADSDCDSAAACQEQCDDTIDNDGDGDADCADSDCVAAPACIEACDDGVDNDLDEAIDCDDADCGGDPACLTCPTALAQADFPITISGDNFMADHPPLFSFLEGGGCEAGTSVGAGADYLFAVDMMQGDSLAFTETTPSATDYILNVTHGGCSPQTTGDRCVYGADDPDNYSFTAPFTGVFYFNLGSFGSAETDAYSMTVNYTEAGAR